MQGSLAAFNQATPANRPTLSASGGIVFGTNLRLTQVSNVPTSITKSTHTFWAYMPSPFVPVSADGFACFYTDYALLAGKPQGIWIAARNEPLISRKGFFLIMGDELGDGINNYVGQFTNPALWDSTYLGRWVFLTLTFDNGSIKFGADGEYYSYVGASTRYVVGYSGQANIGSYLASRYLPAGPKIEAPRIFYGQALTEIQLGQIKKNDQKTFRHLRG
jgi:hypothetical protein